MPRQFPARSPPDMVPVIVRKDHVSNVGQVDLQVACILLNAAQAQALGYENQSRTPELFPRIAKRDHGHWRGVGAYLQPICAVLHSPKELTPESH